MHGLLKNVSNVSMSQNVIKTDGPTDGPTDSDLMSRVHATKKRHVFSQWDNFPTLSVDG